ncbi:hypothetical protein GF324_10620 [bacterium]|nr:hypothetical protein [bacterium]
MGTRLHRLFQTMLRQMRLLTLLLTVVAVATAQSRDSAPFGDTIGHVPDVLKVADCYQNPHMPPNPLMEAYARFGLLGRYEEAEQVIERLRRIETDAYDAEAWADLFELSLLVTRYVDTSDSAGMSVYHKRLPTVQWVFQRELEKADTPQDSAAAFFAMALAEGAEATRLEEDGHRWRALGAVRQSTSLLKLAYELDPELVDAQFGIAIFTYWESKFFGWTPFVKDRRAEAIKTLTSVSEEGVFSRYLAAAGLVWVYIEENDGEKAVEWAKRWIDRIGPARSLLEPLSKAYFIQEKWPKARKWYERYLESLRSMERRNLTREIGALHRLAMIAEEQGDRKGIVEYAEQAEQTPLTDADRSKKKKDLKHLAEMKQLAQDHLP